MQSAFIIQVLLPICCRRNAQVLLDKLAEEGQVGKVEFVADFLDRLVAVAQLLTNSANSGLVNQVKGRATRLVLHALAEILRCDIQHIGKD